MMPPSPRCALLGRVRYGRIRTDLGGLIFAQLSLIVRHTNLLTAT